MENTENNEMQVESAQTLDVERVFKMVENLENDVRNLRHYISTVRNIPGSNVVDQLPITTSETAAVPVGFMKPAAAAATAEDDGIEGIFDGERMLDATGKSYQVPPNYASKSKLVEGDPLKLYITSDGKYLYKQLGPVERKTIPGVLRLEGNHYIVDTDDGGSYSILTACVTYYMSLYNLKVGDRVMILVPAARQSKWAVVDNLI